MVVTVLALVVLVFGAAFLAQDRAPRLVDLGKWMILLALGALLFVVAQPTHRLF
jgi:hypothetical protein